MGCLGNILWFVLGGWILSAMWFIEGLLWCVTIVGIPIGMQCFKFAMLSIAPFGRKVVYGNGSVSLILNVLWIFFTEIPIVLTCLLLGCLLCITIVGIPFGKQYFKLAKLAFMPFGTKIL